MAGSGHHTCLLTSPEVSLEPSNVLTTNKKSARYSFSKKDLFGKKDCNSICAAIASWVNIGNSSLEGKRKLEDGGNKTKDLFL